MNCSKRQDLPTPINKYDDTGIANDDELEHIGKGH
jgi:hypothetical protein